MSDQAIDKEKSILTVDESDILAMSEKIRQNQEEDRAFAEQLDKFLSYNSGRTTALTVSNTPNALAIAGANQEIRVLIRPDTILKCMSKSDQRYHGHDLSVDIMKKLPQELRNPVLIFKGNTKDSLVAITQLKDNKERGIMISVALNASEKHCVVNRVSSMYGRDNLKNYIEKQIVSGNLIAVNNEKADKMFQSLGLQSPPEETFISFDNSIAYSTANVKKVSEKSLEITRETESQTRRGAKKPFGQAQLTQSVKTAKEAERQSPPEQTKEQTKKKDDISL